MSVESRDGIVESLFKGTKYKVLSFLLDRPEGSFTVTEIAEATKVSKPSVSSFVKELEKIGLVERRKKGRTHLISVNEGSGYHDKLKNLLELDVKPLIQAAEDFAGEIEELEDVASIYLFGSVARGTPGIDSDVDILVVMNSDSQTTENKVISIKRRFEDKYGLDLSLMFYIKQELLKDLERGNKFVENLKKESKLLEGEEIFE